MIAEGHTTAAVLVETDTAGVRTLTFYRPERRNGWSVDLEHAYYAAATAAAADPAVRAVVVTGAGTAFCPGADMTQLDGLGADGARLPHRPVSSADRREGVASWPEKRPPRCAPRLGEGL